MYNIRGYFCDVVPTTEHFVSFSFLSQVPCHINASMQHVHPHTVPAGMHRAAPFTYTRPHSCRHAYIAQYPRTLHVHLPSAYLPARFAQHPHTLHVHLPSCRNASTSTNISSFFIRTTGSILLARSPALCCASALSDQFLIC